MGLYNVVVPCVVGKSHHVRPTTAPIEVDDAVAAPLVAAGKLTSTSASARPLETQFAEAGEQAADSFAEGMISTAEEVADEFVDPPAEPEKPVRRPRGRRSGED